MCRMIDADAPTIEPEHKTGRWLYWHRTNERYVSVCCSKCSWLWSGTQEEIDTFKYCPNCGAKMEPYKEEKDGWPNHE